VAETKKPVPPFVKTASAFFAHKLVRQLAIGGVLAALVFVAYQRGLLDGLEFKSLDLRFQIRGPVPVHLPLVIVSIDQDSFDELDLQWPWPRSLHAELIRKLAKAGAKVIAFDVLFTEPSPDPRQDHALADAIRETGNVVLGAEHTEVPGDLGTRTRLSLPTPLIRQYAQGYGAANLIIDSDGIVRSGRFSLPFQDRKFPGFAYRIYEAATGQKPSSGAELSHAAFFINFRGPGRNYPIMPYYRVLRGEFDPAFFRGKIALIGAYSPSLHDFFPTPFSASQPMAGVEIQANFVDTIAAGDPIVPIPGWLRAALFVIFSALSIWASIRFKPLRATATVIGLIALYAFAALYFFSDHQLWIASVPIALACTLSYGGIVLEQYIREQKEKMRIRSMLSRYLSPAAAEEVLNVREGLELEGKRTHITVLFSDVRGFTSLSEHLTPEQVVSLLSDYLGKAANIVHKNKGFLDKFIGDAVFAQFGWPKSYGDDALRAVQTGIEMIELVDSLGPKWTEIIGRPLKVGVGINTGDAVVGNIGSETKSDLTAIGDTVNLGARLEALTKELGVPMLISEFTAAELKDAIALRPLRRVKVQGREAPIMVYCPESLIHGEVESVTDTTTPYVQQHK
jgi:adenylate cyclase